MEVYLQPFVNVELPMLVEATFCRTDALTVSAYVEFPPLAQLGPDMLFV